MPPSEAVVIAFIQLFWPIHFPAGRAFNDEQCRVLMRDAILTAMELKKLMRMDLEELQQIGFPKPPAPTPAAEQTVEAT